jgi:hypothetical protein
LNHAKRRSNLSSFAASPLMLKMVCTTGHMQHWCTSSALDVSALKAHTLTLSLPDFMMTNKETRYSQMRTPDWAACKQAPILHMLHSFQQASHLVNSHLPLTQPVHKLVPHLQETNRTGPAECCWFQQGMSKLEGSSTL